jgi:glycosyltransferase involved in cell wall biosynthesis
MFRSLASHHEVTWVGYKNLGVLLRTIIKLQPLTEKILGIGRGYPYFNKWQSILKAKLLNKHFKVNKYDVIVSPNSPDLVAYLQTNLPIIYLRDTTFQLFVDYYPTFCGLNESVIQQGNEIERRAIANSSALIYSSKWAADSAVQFYGAASNKISIVNFGANLFEYPETIRVEGNYDSDSCNLVFIGVEWERKGGQIAYDTFKRLRNQGLKCKLTVVGCDVDLEEDGDIVVIPFLNKRRKRDFCRLIEIYSKAHFVLLPTVADCTPIVFSEAAAFGVPVLTTDTGGNASVVDEGVNGFLFHIGTDEKVYADKITEVFSDKEYYNKLREMCRHEYDNRLSWKVWLYRLNHVIEKTVAGEQSDSDKVDYDDSFENIQKQVHD